MTEEVVISNHGGTHPRRLPVREVAASWELSHPGAFSCFARLDDLRAAGLGYDLRDRWLEWAHPVLGMWGGVITGRPVEGGLAEIEAEGWAALLRGHLLVEFERMPEGSPGGLARRAVIDAGAVQQSFIRVGMIDEGGEPTTITFGGADALDDVLMSLSQDTGLEWVVDSERTFHAARRLGRDRSPTVRWVEDVHVVGCRLADDIWADVPDEVLGFETSEESARRPVTSASGIAALDPRLSLIASVPEPLRARRERTKHRRRRQERDDDDRRRRKRGPRRHRGRGGGGTQTTTPPPAPHWAWFCPGVGPHTPALPSDHGLLPTTPVEVALLNVDDAWRFSAPGTTVRLDIGSAGFSGWFRIFSRAIDVAASTLVLAGEALADEACP